MFGKSFAAIALLIAGSAAASAQNRLQVTHVNVVDVVTGRIQPDRTLLISDGKIVSISGGPAKAAAGEIVFDAAGKFVIPGLWDMHQHFEGEPGQREFNLMVANGVLGVRNMGGVAKEVLQAREDIRSRKYIGPQIFACGPILDGPEPTNPPFSVAVRNPDDGRKAVQSVKAMRADCVKVHDGVPVDAYLAIADEAKKAGLPLVGHVPVRVPIRQAIDAGQRSIEHQSVFLGASTVEDELIQSEKKDDVLQEAMRNNNFQLIPESIAKKGNYFLDHIDEERAHDLYRSFASHGVRLTPTLVTQRALTFVDDLDKSNDVRLTYIPASQKEWWHPEKGMLTRYRTPAYIAFRKRQFAKSLEQIPVEYRDGVIFLAGTDCLIPYVFPGFSVHDEMALFAQAGLTPLAALQTATLNPARFLGIENSEGTVGAGKAANLVLLDHNPLLDIHNTTGIFAVIVRGKLLKRTDLDDLLQQAAKAAAN
jgi:hypothetical protein